MKSSPTISVPAAALAGLLSVALPGHAAESPKEEVVNEVIELADSAGESFNVRFVTATDLPLYVNRNAGRILDVLSSGQIVTVLAMDRFGLQVRGRGTNGPLTGWIGQKKAFAHDEKRLAKVRNYYERQLEIEQLVAQKQPAIGMTLAELKRILGKPTTHEVGASEEGRTESLTWVIKEKVDLNELLSSGTDEDLLKMEVEVGRVQVDLKHGLAARINLNLPEGGAEIPTVVPPVREPFGSAPAAGKAAAR